VAGDLSFTLVAVSLNRGVPARGRQETIRRLAGPLREVAESTRAGQYVILMGGFTLDATDASFDTLFDAGFVRASGAWGAVDIATRRTWDQLFLRKTDWSKWDGTGGVIPFDELCYGDDDEKAERAISNSRPLWLGLRIPGSGGTRDK
jgi:hypothetical protein